MRPETKRTLNQNSPLRGSLHNCFGTTALGAPPDQNKAKFKAHVEHRTSRYGYRRDDSNNSDLNFSRDKKTS